MFFQSGQSYSNGKCPPGGPSYSKRQALSQNNRKLCGPVGNLLEAVVNPSPHFFILTNPNIYMTVRVGSPEVTDRKSSVERDAGSVQQSLYGSLPQNGGSPSISERILLGEYDAFIKYNVFPFKV